jgi:hypothetical protein
MRTVGVIICTHNPRRDYFERCLAGLRTQTLATDRWEMVVVDNASAPDRAPRPDLAWHPHARMVREEKLGLTPARLLGIRETNADLLVLVDDDNVLDPDYLESALRIAREKPFLGSWSGQCRPEFEEPPPEWTRHFWGSLVIRQFDKDVWSNMPRLADTMPCGAGLCVRREAALYYVHLHESGARSIQFDRTGSSLASGGDNDLAACACDVGLGVGLFTALKLIHLIPSQRLTEDYLARLAEGIARSSTLLDAERGIMPRKRGALGRIADMLRLMRVDKRHRRILRAGYSGRDGATRLLLGRR